MSPPHQTLDNRYGSGSKRKVGRPKRSSLKSNNSTVDAMERKISKLEEFLKGKIKRENCLDDDEPSKPLSERPFKKRRSHSHDSNKYIQKTLASYFIKSSNEKVLDNPYL